MTPYYNYMLLLLFCSFYSETLRGGTPVISSSHGTYNMQIEKVVQEATLDGPTEFECHVTIPKTEVRVVTSIKYQPRKFVRWCIVDLPENVYICVGFSLDVLIMTTTCKELTQWHTSIMLKGLNNAWIWFQWAKKGGCKGKSTRLDTLTLFT